MAENVIIEGTLYWVRSQSPNEWGKYACVIYPKQDQIIKVMELQSKGCKNLLKKDDRGYYVSYSRAEDRGPPKVQDNDGNTISDFVGNGSEGSVKLEVYQHGTPGGGKAHAARLDTIIVTKLVPYERKGSTEQKVEKLF